MSLIVNIEPVMVINQTATQLGASIVSYDLKGKYCFLNWWLLDADNKKIYSDNYKVPESVLASWGTDDDVIINAVAASQGINIIN